MNPNYSKNYNLETEPEMVEIPQCFTWQHSGRLSKERIAEALHMVQKAFRDTVVWGGQNLQAWKVGRRILFWGWV